MAVIVLSLSSLGMDIKHGFSHAFSNWLIPSLLFRNPINSTIGFKKVRARLTGNWDDGKEWECLRDEDGFRIERQGSSRDGLYKRSISIVEKGVTHHVVSYYKLVDAVESYSEEAGVLKSLERPSQDPKFKASQFSPRIVGLCEKTTVLTQSCA